MAVKKDNSKFITGERVLRVELDTEDLPTNVRKAVADVILELVDRLLTQVPDDTKSLSRAINVGSADCFVCLFCSWVDEFKSGSEVKSMSQSHEQFTQLILFFQIMSLQHFCPPNLAEPSMTCLCTHHSTALYYMSFILQIYHGLIFFHGVSKDDFDARWKSFQFIKDALANKLARNKQHIRSLLVERAVLQQESRMLENSTLHFTATHKAIMNNLLHLSTSHYSEVSGFGFCCSIFVLV